MEQRSPEWFQTRLGKVTASRVADVITKTKSGWGASRANYRAQLIAERLTGEAQDSFTNAAMQWGTDTEPHARASYEFRTDSSVTEIGFVDHPKIKMSGASPDGLVGDVGMIEIKCPNTSTHLDVLMSEKVPAKYVTQISWQMACAGRAWCDFVSFDPRLPENMQLFIKRVHRDDDTISQLETDVTDFLAEIDETVAALIEKYGTEENRPLNILAAG